MGKLYWKEILKIIILFWFLFSMIVSPHFVYAELENNTSITNSDMKTHIVDSPYIIENELSYVFESEMHQYGFLDKSSGYLQAPIYDSILDSECSDNNAPILVMKANLYGYVSRTNGLVVIPIVFDILRSDSEFYNGYAIVSKKVISEEFFCREYSYLLDRNGNEVSFPNDIIPDSRVWHNNYVTVLNICTQKRGVAQVIGLSAELVLEPCYDFVDTDGIYICAFNIGDECIHLDVFDSQAEHVLYSTDSYVTSDDDPALIEFYDNSQHIFMCLYGYELLWHSTSTDIRHSDFSAVSHYN